MLSQNQIARYFDRCTDDGGVVEILSGYVVCKFLNGSTCAQVIQKIRYLCHFLRATGRGHILRMGEEAFKAVTFEVAVGSERIGASPATTPAGKELFNLIRQKASKKNFTIVTHPHGGPGAVPTFLSRDQHQRLLTCWGVNIEDRPPWLDRYYSMRCSLLDPVAFALLPEYESQVLTEPLPIYVAREIADGVRNIERELEVSRSEEEL